MPVYIHYARYITFDHPGLIKDNKEVTQPISTDWREINCPVCQRIHSERVMGGHSTDGTN